MLSLPQVDLLMPLSLSESEIKSDLTHSPTATTTNARHGSIRRLKLFINCSAVDDQSTQGKEGNNHPPTKKPCAILLFGLAKKFRDQVLPSIHEHILNISQCDVFAHTYNITTVSSHRNGEDNDTIDPSEILDLTPNVLIETVQDFERQINLTYLLQPRFQVDPKHGWGKESYVNMLKQWHSIEQVWRLMQHHEEEFNIQYDRVGFFRSDVEYISPIDIFNGDAVVPAFGKMTNDRMFYGLYEHAHVWANIRFPSVECYEPPEPTHGLHSEHLMKRLIVKNIPNVTYRHDICFYRVRGNGRVQTGDCHWNHTSPFKKE
jgi:hypothetical protein